MSAESVEAYILKNENNLRIAAAVAEAWVVVRQQLVSEFFDRVWQALKKQLPGWKNERYEEYFKDQYAGFYIGKPAWQNYQINLECHRYGEKMIFGVWRDQGKLAKEPFCGEMLTAVRSKFPSARSRNWWEAEITMQAPARDWRPPEQLWRLRKDETFRDQVVAQLLEVAQIAEPIIDKITKPNPD